VRAGWLSIRGKPSEYGFPSGESQQQREKKCARIKQNA
jgi:hypothetical protein